MNAAERAIITKLLREIAELSEQQNAARKDAAFLGMSRLKTDEYERTQQKLIGLRHQLSMILQEIRCQRAA